MTYHRLGKNCPFAGNLCRNSLSALRLHAYAVIPNITAPTTAVFDFQFAGWQYHPPEGDQTCLGYLIIKDSNVSHFMIHLVIGFLKLGRLYGIFSPGECGTAALFDWPGTTVSPAMTALEVLGDERTLFEL